VVVPRWWWWWWWWWYGCTACEANGVVCACGCSGLGGTGPERKREDLVVSRENPREQGERAIKEAWRVMWPRYVNSCNSAWRGVGVLAVAGVCGVVGMAAREGAHGGGLVQVEARAVCGSESRA